MDQTTLPAAIVSGLVSLVTLLVGLWASTRKKVADGERQAAANESRLQQIALDQSKEAFASVRADVDRYRQDVDRLRAENDRLRAEVDKTTDRLQQVEDELAEERKARKQAEQRADELAAQLAELKQRTERAA